MPEASTESGWASSGILTVANANAYALNAKLAWSSDLGGGFSCAATGGGDVVVPAAGTLTVPYTCSFTSVPKPSGTITATVTWDPFGPETTRSVTRSVPVTFVGSETNKTVPVVDDKTVPGQRIVLDPALTWSPGLVKTYTYSLTVAGGVAGECASHKNTATIDQPVGTDPTASATVKACTPPEKPVTATLAADATLARTFPWSIEKVADADDAHRGLRRQGHVQLHGDRTCRKR